MNERTSVRMNKWNGSIGNERMDRWMNKCVDGWQMDERMNERTNGWMSKLPFGNWTDKVI